MTEWKTIDRPSYFGARRDSIQASYDQKYGEKNWRLVHKFGDTILEFNEAIQIYEDAYFMHMIHQYHLPLVISEQVKEVYDNSETNVASGLNYNKQENNSNHYQDITIRRIMFRFGLIFKGDKLIQIRHKSDSKLGQSLSPGRVPFHLKHLIETPHKIGWWDDGSVECFWQSNKILQVKDSQTRL